MAKKIILTVLLSIIGIILILSVTVFPAIRSLTTSLSENREAVINVINRRYKDYEIKDLKLSYVDWSRTIREADEHHIPTKATVIIENENEQLTIRLEKNYFNNWKIKSANPNYGPNVPNDVYFVKINGSSIGKAKDINEYVKKVWAIPDEKGNLYKKEGSGSNWYYSVNVYSEIYKTKDGYVYEFNKETSGWKKSNKNYDYLCTYGYKKISKDEAIKILEKYSSYRENSSNEDKK